jgi:hypothetical protein
MSLRIGRRWKVVCAGDARVIHEQARGGRPPDFAKGRMDVRNRIMIWRRYSAAQASTTDKLRLLADFALLVLLDAGSFLRRPWRAGALLHGLGILWALTECMMRPPYFDEHRQQTRYQVHYQAL